MEPSVWEVVVSFVLLFGMVDCSGVADCTGVSETAIFKSESLKERVLDS